MLTDKLEDEGKIDPVKEILTMREHRTDMVQNAVSVMLLNVDYYLSYHKLFKF